MKKSIIYLITAFLLTTGIDALSQGVAINANGSSPDTSAMLEVSSTVKGVLVPRLTEDQRNAIAIPATGLIIFQTNNTPGFYFYNGSSWVAVGSEALYINDLVDGKTGQTSVFLGSGAGAGDNGSDTSENVGVGMGALNANVLGVENTAIGHRSLYNNTGNANTASGFKSLYNNTSGGSNNAFGYQALHENTSGGSNIAMGYKAMLNNTTGSSNIGIGYKALHENDTAHYNIGIGYYANGNNKYGSMNTIIGHEAGRQGDTNSSGNIFLGYKAGFYETGDSTLYIENGPGATPLIYGEFNNDLLRINGTLDINNEYIFPTTDGTAGQILTTNGNDTLRWISNPGVTALQWPDTSNQLATDYDVSQKQNISDTSTVDATKYWVGQQNYYSTVAINDLTDGKTGGNSVFLGTNAGTSDDGTYNRNIGFGVGALFSNTSGKWNIAIGYDALKSNTTYEYNIAIGNKALYSNTSGGSNIAIGAQVLENNTDGDYNTGIGDLALFENETGDNNTAIGKSALYKNTTGAQNTVIGSSALFDNITGTGNTANGYRSLANNTTGNSNTAIGLRSLYSNTTRSNLVAIGDSALFNNGIGATGDWEAKWNTAVGSGSLKSNTTGFCNTAIGFQSLSSNTYGDYNTAFGCWALHKNTSYSGNTAFGYRALYENTTGFDNTATGKSALYANTDGDQCTAYGYDALHFNTTGDQNVGVGDRANYYNTSGSRNTILGSGAGYGSSSNSISNNVFLGFQAGYSAEGDSNIFIGFNAGYSETGNQKLYIENSNNSTTPLIGGDFAADEVYLHGDVGIGNSSPLERFHVAENNSTTDGSDGSFALIQNTNTSTKVLSGIRFKNGTTSNTSKGGIFYRDTLGWGRGDIVFVNNSVDGQVNATYADARMIIKNDGNVGIGLTSPTADLHVAKNPIDDEAIFGTDISTYNAGSVVSIGSDDALALLYIGQSTATKGRIAWEYNSTPAMAYLSIGTFSSVNDLVLQKSGGKVGIGTTNPGAELEVNGQVKITGGTPGASKVLTSDANGLASWQDAAGDITTVGSMTSDSVFANANADDNWLGLGAAAGRIEFDDQTMDEVNILDANVGIGTASPSDKLHLEDDDNVSAKIIAGTSDTASLKLMESGNYGFEFQYDGSVDKLHLWSRGFSGNEAKRMTWQKDGKVGIGTTSPSAKLEVYDGTLSITNMAETADEDAIKIGIDGEHDASIKLYDDDGEATQHFKMTYSAATEDLRFHSDQVDNILYMTQAGKVGIGTTSPGSLLEVNGGGSDAVAIIDVGAEDVNSSGLRIRENGSDRWMLLYRNWQSNSLHIYDDLANTEVMTFESNTGNVGIGTTSPGAKLEVNGQVKITGGSPGTGKILTSDANGLASWSAYSVGDFVQGGIVFWVDETGQHGLVCAKTDQSSGIRWYAGTNGNTRALGAGPYSGEANTSIIIAAQVAIGDDGSTYAARVCNEVQITEGGKTYGNWYLPSYEELSLMYQNRSTINSTATANGGSVFSESYWSSSEVNSTQAWILAFSSGVGAVTDKNSTTYVRAVRAF